MSPIAFSSDSATIDFRSNRERYGRNSSWIIIRSVIFLEGISGGTEFYMETGVFTDASCGMGEGEGEMETAE